MRVENQTKLKSEKTRVYAQKPGLKMPFKNSISVLASMYLWILDVSHKADMDEARDGLLKALQAHNEGLSLHRQVK
jgi:hypothetical protein